MLVPLPFRRRAALTLSVEGLTAESKPVREERRGPKVGAPEKAIEGFLRGAGVALEDLEIRDDKKGQVYFAVVEKPGRMAADIIAEVLENAIRNFPWPKSMRWGSGTLKWVRPLHSILCILGDEAGTEVVPLDVDGIVSGNTTRGHRFLAPDTFSVASFDDYEAKLKRANVVLRADERAEAIWHDATHQAFALGLEVVEDRGLLAEVAGLVEWPVVLLGRIDDDFLGLPPEVLQTSMKEHQKVLFRAQSQDQPDRAFRDGRQHGNRRSGCDHSGRQPKGAGRASRGCEILLGKRSAGGQSGDGPVVRQPCQCDVPQQTGLADRPDRTDRGFGARNCTECGC